MNKQQLKEMVREEVQKYLSEQMGDRAEQAMNDAAPYVEKMQRHVKFLEKSIQEALEYAEAGESAAYFDEAEKIEENIKTLQSLYEQSNQLGLIDY